MIAGFSLITTACALKIVQGQSLKVAMSTTKYEISTAQAVTVEGITKPHTSSAPHDLVLSSHSSGPFAASLKPQLRLSKENGLEINKSDTNLSPGTTELAILLSTYVDLVNDSSKENSTTHHTEQPFITITGVVGILGFAFIDVGFDLGNPMVRAFVLDHTPSGQHSGILVTATLMASLSGTLMSTVGVFDIPGALESVVDIDGTAATFILIVSLLVVIVTCSYTISMATGIKIRRAETLSSIVTEIKPEKRLLEDLSLRQKHEIYGKKTPFKLTNIIWKKKGRQQILETYEDYRHIVAANDTKRSGSFAFEERTPLLSNESQHLSISFSVSSLAPVDEYAYAPIVEEEHDFIAEEIPEEVSENAPADALERSTLTNASEIIPEVATRFNFSTSILSDKNGLHKPSMQSLDQQTEIPTLGDFHQKKIAELTASKRLVSARKSKPGFFNKQLVILVTSIVFSMSSMTCFIMYIPNALTLGIFKADPLALPGTKENELYKQGLRTAALGSLIFYVSYFVTCVLNNRIFALLGEKPYVIVFNTLLTAVTVALLVTQRVEVYFLAMAAFGPFRTCIYTVPFILANRYTQGESSNNSKSPAGDTSQGSNKLGRVMALIGFLLPFTYTLVSSIMGPAIELTGNVWIPLIWTCVGVTISSLIFSLLFFLKG